MDEITEQPDLKKNIAIIMGGFSSEYEISIKSGQVIYETLFEEYNCYRIHVFKDRWVYVDDKGIEYLIDKNEFTVEIDGDEITFDCVFNAIHGSPGEDGYMQGYLEMLEIPHTSSGMYESALTFNKRDCLMVLKKYGVKTADSFYLNEGDAIDKNDIVESVGLPCFVKANRAGSSFGISKVYKIEDLDEALEVAFKEDKEVLIESYLDGTEVSVGVITYKGEVLVLPITEIVSKNDFFDYKAKYLGESEEITPARIDESLRMKVEELAAKIYSVLGLKGFSRSEFIFKNGEPHLLEVNTVPGFTKASILPQQAAKAGIDLKMLFSNAIEEAMKAQH